MSLRDALLDLAQSARARRPADAQAVIDAALDDLRRSGIDGICLQRGETAPDFTLPAAGGGMVSLEALLRQGPAVVTFYRGGWCPYCNRHIGALKSIDADLRALGYRLLFVSPDRPEVLYESLKEPDVTFTLLSDASMSAARALGIAFRVDDPTHEKYRSFGIDLDAASGYDHLQLPVPAVFVVRRDGRIAYVHANPDYTQRLSPEALLEAARRASASPAGR